MKIKISKIKPNDNNPRFIKDYKFKQLVQSIRDFPQMLELRPIIVNENMVVLGGNMRLKACIEAGLKEVHIDIAKGLTEEQQKEFIVKDNVGFGQWDWDMLANEWDTELLSEWGLDVINLSENYGEDELDEELDFTDKEEVIINLTMPFYEYEKIEEDFQSFIKKYPNIVCQIRN